jgi:hypothetical protein
MWQDGFDAWFYSPDNDTVDDLRAPHWTRHPTRVAPKRGLGA